MKKFKFIFIFAGVLMIFGMFLSVSSNAGNDNTSNENQTICLGSQDGGEDQITFAKKLMRAKDSPVFSLSKEKLMLNVKNSKAYTKLINNDEFVIDTKDKARKFVGMLNDQLLVSELTGEIYDASVKKKIND